MLIQRWGERAGRRVSGGVIQQRKLLCIPNTRPVERADGPRRRPVPDPGVARGFGTAGSHAPDRLRPDVHPDREPVGHDARGRTVPQTPPPRAGAGRTLLRPVLPALLCPVSHLRHCSLDVQPLGFTHG